MERSTTPIVQRIIDSIVNSLTRLGHVVELVDLRRFTGPREYVNYLNEQSFDYVLITSMFASLSKDYIGAEDRYAFEFVNSNIIFIHHDSLFNIPPCSPTKVWSKLKAFHLYREKIYHFCLEYSTFLDLRSLGISNVAVIQHASEFSYLVPPEEYQYQLSFLGHVSPFMPEVQETEFSHRVISDMWRRVVSPGAEIDVFALDWALRHLDSSNIVDILSFKQSYISNLHSYSLFHRAEIMKKIKEVELDIIEEFPRLI